MRAFATRLATAAAVTSQTLLIVLNLMNPDLAPSWQTLSDWATIAYGWL